jgi:hypothetical protein
MVGNRIAVLSGDRDKAGRSLALFQRQWLIASLCHGDTAKTAIEGENSGQTTPSDRDACQAHRSVAAGTKGGLVLFHGAIVTGALLPQCYLDHAGCSGADDGLAGTGAVAIWRRMMSGELFDWIVTDDCVGDGAIKGPIMGSSWTFRRASVWAP